MSAVRKPRAKKAISPAFVVYDDGENWIFYRINLTRKEAASMLLDLAREVMDEIRAEERE